MKKKLLVLAMTGLMTASVLTACGGKETAAETTVAETTVAETAAETTAAETTTAADAETIEAAAEEDAAITKFDEYLAWTGKEWTAASDEEKLNAAIVYSVYTTEALTGEEFDAETRALAVAEMRNAEDIMNVVTQLDAVLPKFDKSIKDFADTGVEQMKTMIEAETEAATE